MSQSEGAVGTYKKWDFDARMEVEKQDRRKVPKGGIGVRERLWGSRDTKLESFRSLNRSFAEIIAKF